MKEKTFRVVIGLTGLSVSTVLLILGFFVFQPWSERETQKWYEEHPNVYVGKIILVTPQDVHTHARVYFEDGTIMTGFDYKDISQLSHYINQKVRITFGYNEFMEERKLLRLEVME